jgi:chorismate mutase/prephenate dehydratase
MSIDDLRRAIDELDESLLELLNRRAQRVSEIGRLKGQDGAAIFDPARERRILDRLASLNRGPLSQEAIAEIFGAIFAVHRLLEKRLTVAYYGPAGSFTHLAARRKFGTGADLTPADTIADVFAAVENKEADLGVVPIENSTGGVVPLTLDALVESKLQICAEIYVDVEHYLLSRCADLDDVKRVYSHPNALAQCRIWLRSNLPRTELIPIGNTARAAELAASEAGSAAIGPILAGELYEVPVLRARIHDQPDNRTRFFVIGHAPAAPSGRDKTSVVFSVRHEAGALHRALGLVSKHQINMTFIQSHPTKRTPWEYMFFVDVQGHAGQPGLREALAELRDEASTLRVLGSYPEEFPQ